ncbi:MAG: hypothetical protein D6739_11320, partial [Nitrospirae bacterium]
MVRLKAFAIHLAASVAVATCLVVLLVSRYFPLPYFFADGGWQGLRLVVAVDAVLGPLLTLIIFNPAKGRRALLRDYTVIVLLQIGAFAFGAWTVFAHHTALVVYADGTFYTVDAEEARHLPDPLPELVRNAKWSPAYAVVVMPEDLDQRQALRREALRRKRPLYVVAPDRVRPLTPETAAEIEAGALSPEAIADLPPEALQRFLADHGGLPHNYRLIPL